MNAEDGSPWGLSRLASRIGMVSVRIRRRFLLGETYDLRPGCVRKVNPRGELLVAMDDYNAADK